MQRKKKKSNSGREKLKYKEKASFVVKLWSEMNTRLLLHSGLCHVQQTHPIHAEQAPLTVFATYLMKDIVAGSDSKYCRNMI